MYRLSLVRTGCRILRRHHIRQKVPNCVWRPSTVYQVEADPVSATMNYSHRDKSTIAGKPKINIEEILSKESNDGANVCRSFITLLKETGELSEKECARVLATTTFAVEVSRLRECLEELSPPDVIRCLRHLRLLYPTRDPEIIVELEDRFKSFGYHMSVNHLTEYVESHGGAAVAATGLRVDALSRAKQQLLMRWTEITDPATLVNMLFMADAKSILNLEIKTMELVSKMNSVQLFHCLKALVHHKRHNAPLIRALTYHLHLQWKNTWTFNKLVKLGTFCATLSIFNEKLLANWSSALSGELKRLISESNEVPVDNVYACVRALGLLRWRDSDLIDSLVSSALSTKDTQLVKLNELLAMCAKVNYLPDQLREALPSLCDQLPDTFMVNEPRSYLQIIWDLCLLEAFQASKINPEIILSDNFTDLLKAMSKPELYSIHCLKLMNISATVKLEMDPTDIQLLPDDFLQQNNTQVILRKHRPALKTVTEALSSLEPKIEFNCDVQCSLGYTIDIEMLVNSDGIVQPMSSELPDLTRLAVKVLEYSDTTLNECVPISRLHMMERHLTKAGYSVIKISYKELAALDTVEKQVSYLQTILNIKTELNKAK